MASVRRKLLVPPGWWQSAIVVMIFGFTIMGILAYLTYTDEPPIPSRVVSPTQSELFSAEDVRRGQEVFLSNGLMEYGSMFGHGGYLGSDYAADYLHRAALDVQQFYGGQTPPSCARSIRYDRSRSSASSTSSSNAVMEACQS